MSYLFDHRIDGDHLKPDEREDHLLLRGDKNPNTRGAELLGVRIPLTAAEMLKKVGEMGISGLYIQAPERIVSDDLISALKTAREKLQFVVMQATHRCDLLSLADVVLAGVTFAEKEGTFVNYQGRVQKITRAVPPFGNSKTDLEILGGLISRSGKGWRPLSAAAVFDAISLNVPAFSGLRFDELSPTGVLIRN